MASPDKCSGTSTLAGKAGLSSLRRHNAEAVDDSSQSKAIISSSAAPSQEADSANNESINTSTRTVNTNDSRPGLGVVGSARAAVELPSHRISSLPSSSPKRKLGRVGGSQRAATPPNAGSSQRQPAQKPSPSGKLGKVEGKPTQRKLLGADAITADSHGYADQVKTEEQPPSLTSAARESSLELAYKKRDELKRQLEQKSSAPVKKKRKF